MESKDLHFPKQFLWGASTSSHQVEGGLHNNWTVWELENAKSLAKAAEYKMGHLPIWPEVKDLASSPENYVSGRAIDHYNRYESDFDIMQKMNLNAFRFSIEWSRIEPKEGVWDAAEIEHYRQYIKALKKRGLEPMVTLFHWSEPVWFLEKGAFEHAGNVKYFVRFAEKILEELGSDLRYITTINEPDTVVGLGYWLQEHPPQKTNLLLAFWVYRNLLSAHKKVYSLAHKMSRRYKVGFVKGYTCVKPADDSLLTKFMVWLDPKLRDGLVLSYTKRKLDFIGVNYYFTDYYSGTKIVVGQNSHFTQDRLSKPLKMSEGPVSDLGWTVEPADLELVLRRVAKYKKPLYVMETGVADKNDVYRKSWLNETIRAIHNVLKDGVDVRSYLHWSAFDNFEWAFGRWPCFGLIGIDYDNDLKRFARPSARAYAAFVKKARGGKA